MINLLNRETIDKIAAGEVIERPDSVVKELLENSIDSGAKSISIEIREGGTGLIRVTDNGCGIEKEDIPKAFLRHATSKLSEASDLFRIHTMGFRGEALASISGVSEVEMITREQGSMFGYRYRISGGRELDLTEIGAPEGTTVIARNLFYNVPARKKFLKSKQTETSHITDMVEKEALSHPEISFRLTADGRNQLHTAGSGKLLDVIYTIYGREISENLIPVEHSREGITVRGYIGKPVIARAKRDFEVYFVNRRYVRSSIVEKAVEDAYHPFMMLHRFPFVLLNIETDPERVDVNVHPKKMEVRFSDNEGIYQAVYETVSNALMGRELITEVKPEPEKSEKPSMGISSLPVEKERKAEPFEEKKERYEQQSLLLKTAPLPSEIPSELPVLSDRAPETGYQKAPKGAEEKQPENPGKKFLDPASLPSFRMIGQLFETYWLIEFSDKLYIIDQHAAHEKVNYERMMAAFRKKQPESQMILPPISLNLSAGEALLLQKNLQLFQDLGYEIDENGDRDFLVRAVPSNLYSIASKELLLEILDGMSEERGSNLPPDLLRDRIATMSCKAAVKGNNYLSREEMEALIRELLTLENPYACPHGRPTIISMSKYELDKKFKRIV